MILACFQAFEQTKAYPEVLRVSRVRTSCVRGNLGHENMIYVMCFDDNYVL